MLGHTDERLRSTAEFVQVCSINYQLLIIARIRFLMI